MSTFRPTHEMHKRRASRNIGLGLVLAAFVVLAFSVTIVKMSQKQSDDPRALNFDPTAPSAEASQ
jgi:hypothetical protein